MKRCLIILVLFCGLFNKVCAQSPSAAVDSLVKFRVISAKQVPALKTDLKRYKNDVSYRIAILAGLHGIMLQKVFHVNPRKTGISFSYSDSYIKHIKNKDSINISLRVLLNKINKAGLLTDRVYSHTLKDIDSGLYVAEVQLTGSLVEMSSRLEWLAPGKLMPVAEQLHKSGIVNDSSFVRLQNDIRTGKIESAFELNDYCTLDRTLNLKKYPDDPHLWLEQMHRDIASILPGLNFTNFSYTTARDSASSIPGMPEIKYKVSLTCNGRVYKHTSTTFEYGNKKGIQPTYAFTGFLYRIFNKVLADQQSPFRLHNIMFSMGARQDGIYRHIALIALQAEQAEIFMKDTSMSYMLVSMDSYDNTLTSGRIDSTIAGWRKIGLFSHLTGNEIVKAIDDAEADNRYSINKLLSNFPGVTYSLRSEMMSPQAPYSEVLKNLAGIAHGAFNPTKITQKKIKGGIKLQYLFNGRLHAHTFYTANGWLGDAFASFIKHLGQENNLAGSFYILPYEDEVVYLTDEQHADALKNKLLNFGRWEGRAEEFR